jgi:hypothetical protein
MSLFGRRLAFLGPAVVGFSLVLAAAGAADCPSDKVKDILSDPVVQDGLKDAWEDSDEGTPGEHEEGGFVLECVSIGADGTPVYELRIIRVPAGDNKQMKPVIPDLPPGCRVIAFFHTHPGPEKGHPEWDGFENDEESGRDAEWADNHGLPGIIVYGTGPEYDDDTETITFGRESPLDSCEVPEKKAAETKGDPHLSTFDGFVYSFQAVGEYVMATDGDIEIQARFEPVRGSTVASSTTAVAVRLGASVAMVHLDGELRLNGDVVAEFPPEVEGVAIDRGGEDAGDGTVRFVWPDTTTLIVSNRWFLLNVRLETLRFGWEGLFGDGDENPDNDLVGIDGPLDGRVDFAALYGELRPQWAVDPDTSLFTYRAGESNESFFDDAFPSEVVGFADFDEADVEFARDVCVEAMVWLPPYVEDCMYDFLVTGDPEVVEAAAAAHQQQYHLVNAGRIEESAQFTGLVDVERGGVIYLVEGDPGTLVSVGVDAIREVDRCPRLTADFRLVILDRRGEEIDEAWPGNTGCVAYGPWEIPGDGRLAMLIRSGDHFLGEEEDPPRTGSFTLTIGAPNGRTEEVLLGLEESTAVEGRIAIPLDFVDYQVRGEPGDLVSAAVVSLNDIAECEREVWDIQLTALDTDGLELGRGWPGNEGCTAYGGWEIPADGELIIRVHGGTGAMAPMTGEYRLDIGRYRYDIVAVDTGQGPQHFSGSVEIALDGTIYEITAPAGSQVSVDVVSMNNQVDCWAVWDLRLFVSDSDGEEIAEEWPGNFGCRSFGPWTVPESGTLEVLARGSDYWRFPRTGTYELEISAK